MLDAQKKAVITAIEKMSGKDLSLLQVIADAKDNLTLAAIIKDDKSCFANKIKKIRKLHVTPTEFSEIIQKATQKLITAKADVEIAKHNHAIQNAVNEGNKITKTLNDNPVVPASAGADGFLKLRENEVKAAKVILNTVIADVTAAKAKFATVDFKQVENGLADATKQYLQLEQRVGSLRTEVNILQQQQNPLPATMLMAIKHLLSGFIDKVILVDKKINDGLVSIAPSGVLGHTVIRMDKEDAPVSYKGVRLNAGDRIRSYADFRSNSNGAPVARGILEQDQTGKVTCTLEGAPFAKEDFAKLALRQAEMLLSNNLPAKNEDQSKPKTITISGDSIKLGNAVYAALLMFMQHDDYKNIHIKSNIAGIGPGLLTSNHSFIEKHLGFVTKEIREQMVKDTTLLMKSMKKDLYTSKIEVKKPNCNDFEALKDEQEYPIIRP